MADRWFFSPVILQALLLLVSTSNCGSVYNDPRQFLNPRRPTDILSSVPWHDSVMDTNAGFTIVFVTSDNCPYSQAAVPTFVAAISTVCGPLQNRIDYNNDDDNENNDIDNSIKASVNEQGIDDDGFEIPNFNVCPFRYPFLKYEDDDGSDGIVFEDELEEDDDKDGDDAEYSNGNNNNDKKIFAQTSKVDRPRRWLHSSLPPISVRCTWSTTNYMSTSMVTEILKVKSTPTVSIVYNGRFVAKWPPASESANSLVSLLRFIRHTTGAGGHAISRYGNKNNHKNNHKSNKSNDDNYDPHVIQQHAAVDGVKAIGNVSGISVEPLAVAVAGALTGWFVRKRLLRHFF